MNPGLDGWTMAYPTLDDLDAALIVLGAQAYDLAERDLNVRTNLEELRAVALAILQRLDERERRATVQTAVASRRAFGTADAATP